MVEAATTAKEIAIDCFEIQYPLSLAFPDSTVTEFASRTDLKTALRAWRAVNRDATEHPNLSIPISGGTRRRIAARKVAKRIISK